MNALFVELPEFSRHREEFMDDEEFRALQCLMLKSPEAGALIEGTGGLRKLRYAYPHRGRGKRSGLRIIYYWCDTHARFWLCRLYAKADVNDTNTAIRKMFGKGLVRALAAPERSTAVIMRRLPKVSSHYRAPKHAMKADTD
ncbi:toxin [Achromobacter xylosoxidans]|uniref:toxin n=1 Tax=Alcaligenes xylosoxydans xylosoxydans TaxID=85698 RepID=UPI001F1488A6|nr:toxin [Achromobacter xylosoxidans]